MTGGTAASVIYGERGAEKMASIRDVAKQAGVGVGTVSRALNGTGYVSPYTKKKIEKSAEKL